MKMIDIVFDGPPGPTAGRFVEVERDGKSFKLGEWIQREDGYWVLRIPDSDLLRNSLQKAAETFHDTKEAMKLLGRPNVAEAMEIAEMATLEILKETDQ